MGIWDNYDHRMAVRGMTRRDTVLKREKRTLSRKVPDSLSYQSVLFFDREHGWNIDTPEVAAAAIEQNVAIINSDNLNEKYIYSLPDEDIEQGSLVSWADNYWLVTELDANKTVYTSAKMIQCNYLLKWVSAEGQIIEQWCIVEDGTKLKHMPVCDSLVCRKRQAKRIPLIAGTPLEPFELQRRHETVRRESLRIVRIGQSAAKPRIEEGSTTIPDVGVGASAPKWGTLTRVSRYGEDVVCAPQKVRRCARRRRTGVASPRITKRILPANMRILQYA